MHRQVLTTAFIVGITVLARHSSALPIPGRSQDAKAIEIVSAGVSLPFSADPIFTSAANSSMAQQQSDQKSSGEASLIAYHAADSLPKYKHDLDSTGKQSAGWLVPLDHWRSSIHGGFEQDTCLVEQAKDPKLESQHLSRQAVQHVSSPHMKCPSLDDEISVLQLKHMAAARHGTAVDRTCYLGLGSKFVFEGEDLAGNTLKAEAHFRPLPPSSPLSKGEVRFRCIKHNSCDSREYTRPSRSPFQFDGERGLKFGGKSFLVFEKGTWGSSEYEEMSGRSKWPDEKANWPWCHDMWYNFATGEVMGPNPAAPDKAKKILKGDEVYRSFTDAFKSWTVNDVVYTDLICAIAAFRRLVPPELLPASATSAGDEGCNDDSDDNDDNDGQS
eukprot:gnl/TRDRNA2_/TRDRNA2_130990_c0_seq1.p1 gnl/TRDRNA2_/TRDRNA2_130990_c0~~gnl/TRDRNA2_/TRDRNA2_130990_c0_seq1.p1  ORF type:complete len:386 (-),score=36.77 gnl/TRDRNA2_/TRDRNA2_130990_c0_seq1:247-1404(-)